MSGVNTRRRSVLYVGQSFYHHWYLSRELRKIGWKADQLNIDPNLESQKFYHGQDYDFNEASLKEPHQRLNFFMRAILDYDIFHFANAHGIYFLTDFDNPQYKRSFFGIRLISRFVMFILNNIIKWRVDSLYSMVYFIGFKRTISILKRYSYCLPDRWDIFLLKKIGKKIVYTHSGCLDGVSQTSFRKWTTELSESVCDICPYKDDANVCSDEKNLAWGKFRNEIVDYQCTCGGNRVDYNISPSLHEVPQVVCLDKNFWSPDIIVPTNYKLPLADNTVKIYHAVGNFDNRSAGIKTIKSTHIYVPLIENLKKEGFNIELLFFKDVPNKILRYYQSQADIFVDMLTYGFLGANIREGLMLGKPCVCYLRPVWLEQMKQEIPEYVNELPIVNANPNNIREVLIDLITHPEKRKEIGKKSREFAVKWHSSDNAAIVFDKIYSDLINGL